VLRRSIRIGRAPSYLPGSAWSRLPDVINERAFRIGIVANPAVAARK
jgi:hypothetical protein